MIAAEIRWTHLDDLSLRGHLTSLDDDIAEAAENERLRREHAAGRARAVSGEQENDETLI